MGDKIVFNQLITLGLSQSISRDVIINKHLQNFIKRILLEQNSG